MKIDTLSVDFSDEQKRYLEGFTTGLQISRVGRGLGGSAGKANAEPTGPDAVHIKAQDKVIAAGKKLADQEKFKRDEHPFDAYPRLRRQALDNTPPSPADNFRWRYYGIFYVAPTQDSYMCRLRIPNGIMKHWQLSGLADLADELCGPYSHVTTRANLQLREIPPKNAIRLIEGIQDLGLCSRGSGADNIRNVTGTPTAGIDPQELIDTRPYAREWHYHILNDRSLYGLPRKFNVAFDGAGRIAVLEETNDIAFTAFEVKDGFGVEPGVWFRLGLGGITGHKDFAKYSNIIVKPEQATAVADAIVRVFIDHGDRTNRNKARLKYVLDAMGHDGFLKLVEERLKTPFTRVPEEAFAPRPAADRMAHIGVHKQKQDGLNWIGVSLTLGKISCDQMRGLAKVSRDLGDGEIRLTVWQNLLISGVRDENVELAVAAIKQIGLAVEASHIRAGLIACTGSAGCRFAASNTKRNAAEIGDWCEPRVAMDKPVNIHVTGCHHSCAQHYISDIGLIGARVPINDEDTVEGYHLFTGGGFGPDADVGQEVYHDLKAEDAPKTVEGLLKAYIAHRSSPDETFLSFARRHDGETLRKLADAQVSA
ncbi:ferredoxin-nitrite reductase [Bradyrhizobium japonicum]|nr:MULTISPECIES: NirA family protein [Bradyrhizobium]MBR0879220.1 NirA family protein [Bradyrhizobium liaoningense]MBR0941824.1 NirA family protein [Bradyrhizobium liaoningense]MBR0998553.1 NirA family protein [Bradyrhizobium liaoningense]MBR1028070.1 NirA family protein [Bradyrhizobium liaoningense]MBR1065773.1 NirA family protein [Bradyrhizobium liaoningense]